MASLPLLLDESHLPGPELRALRLDGELRELGDGFVPIDVPVTAQLRAQALARQLAGTLIAERLTAAWIWGAYPLLRRPVQACVRSQQRTRILPTPGLVIRQVTLTHLDLVLSSALRVTTPFRTAVDILRWEPEFDRRIAVAVTTLLLAADATPLVCARRIADSPHLPHKQRSLARLSTLPGWE
jgi:hypothetical protein